MTKIADVAEDGPVWSVGKVTYQRNGTPRVTALELTSLHAIDLNVFTLSLVAFGDYGRNSAASLLD